MNITKQNIGDVLCFRGDATLVQILDVTPELVSYVTETGERFSSSGHNMPCTVVNDAERISQFSRNSIVGEALAAAQARANIVLANPHASPEDRQEATSVLRTAAQQRQYLSDKIDQMKKPSRTSLDVLIQQANKEQAAQRNNQQPKKTNDRQAR